MCGSPQSKSVAHGKIPVGLAVGDGVGAAVGVAVPESADVQRLPPYTAATSFVPSALEATERQALGPPAVVTSVKSAGAFNPVDTVQRPRIHMPRPTVSGAHNHAPTYGPGTSVRSASG